MSDKAEYRSSIRSKKLIRSALIELLQVKEPDKITVTDIVQKADLNRGTFYAHYADIHALVQSIQEEVTDSLYRLLDDAEYPRLLNNPLPMFLKISAYLEENRELLTVLMNFQTANPFITQLPDLIAGHLSASEDIDEEVRNSAAFKARCYFYAGGAGSLYMAWFRGEVEGSLEDLAHSLTGIIWAAH